MKNEQQLLEALSALEHEQWMYWAKKMLAEETISPERRARWEASFVPYDQLPDDVKNQDRLYARKVLNLLKKSTK